MTRVGFRSRGTKVGFSTDLVRLAVTIRRQFVFGLTLYGLAMIGSPWPTPTPVSNVTETTPSRQGVAMPGHPERLEPGRRLTTEERALWTGLETAAPSA